MKDSKVTIADILRDYGFRKPTDVELPCFLNPNNINDTILMTDNMVVSIKPEGTVANFYRYQNYNAAGWRYKLLTFDGDEYSLRLFLQLLKYEK